MTQAMSELGGHLELKRPDCVLGWNVAFGELNVDVASSNIAGFVEFLKTDPSCRFSTLVDITLQYRSGRSGDLYYHASG